jgi:hypothetical protein
MMPAACIRAASALCRNGHTDPGICPSSSCSSVYATHQQHDAASIRSTAGMQATAVVMSQQGATRAGGASGMQAAGMCLATH